jgi:hypothetical protein
MLSQTQHQSFVSFTENIALLSLLSRAPAEPQENPRPQWADDENRNRALSFDHEADLTRALAFVAGISDSPSHVVATCVEERRGGKGIRVVVAINKEHPGSGNDILDRIKSGLEKLFRRLACAGNGVSSK